MKKLTPAQMEAVKDPGSSMVIAAAGSGKTLVLVQKVAYLLSVEKIPPEKIVVVTFTEKAAVELKHRIPAPQPFIGTIHSLAASLLKIHGEKIGLNRQFTVMDDPLAFLEMERNVREGILDHLESGHPEILKMAEEFGLSRSVRILQDLMKGSHESPYKNLVSLFNERYTLRKQELNRLDFNDLERLLLQLLQDPSVTESCRRSFRWIFVDEFQDTSPIQWEILSKLHSPALNQLCVVGDPRQSIYRFRGADPDLFARVKGLFEREGKIFYLSENFRSQASVIDLVNRITGPLFEGAYPPLIPIQRDGAKTGGFELLSLSETRSLEERRKIEAQAVASCLKQFQKNGLAWKEMALLFRTRKAIPIFERIFNAEAIPYESKGGESLLEKREVLSLFMFLRALARPEDSIASFGVGRSRLAPLQSDLGAFRKRPDILGLLQEIQEKSFSHFPDEIERTNVVLFFKLLHQLLELGAKSVVDLVRSIESLRDEEAILPAAQSIGSKEAVPILTIHGAKGLEFRAIFLCDLGARRTTRQNFFIPDENGTILLKERDLEAPGLRDRLKKSEAFEVAEAREKRLDLEETKRLLYVALTRAIETIVFPLETGKKRPSNELAQWIYPHVLHS